MSLGELVRRLNNLAATLDNQGSVTSAREMMAARIKKNARFNQPSGRSIRNLTERSFDDKRGVGVMRTGLGPNFKVGAWNGKPPRGTIASFLKDHADRGENFYLPPQLTWMHKAYGAWGALSPEAKYILNYERLSGKYGGERAAGVGMSPYVMMQDGSIPEHRAAAMKAHIKPTRFLRTAFDEFAGIDVPNLVTSIIRREMHG